MRVVNSPILMQRLCASLKKKGRTIGFVPTMGALHDGHISLLNKSRRENKVTVLSIFVNPLQFGPKEDFARYPRPVKKDLLLAKKSKVDIIFYPSVDDMYPPSFLTEIRVNEMTKGLCGAFRPGHFTGVTTVVGKLLNIVLADKLYLGQKDAQQAAILHKMVLDLNFPLKVITCPTLREKDGLAMSSRNIYLNSQQRQEAPILYQSLKAAKGKILQGLRSSKAIISLIQKNISEHSCGRIQYIECVSAETLKPLVHIKGRVLIALAVFFGQTRLIDNIIVDVK